MEKEEYLSAEFEYNKALALDEQSVRANLAWVRPIWPRVSRTRQKRF